jgi:hypothetical protein
MNHISGSVRILDGRNVVVRIDDGKITQTIHGPGTTVADVQGTPIELDGQMATQLAITLHEASRDLMLASAGYQWRGEDDGDDGDEIIRAKWILDGAETLTECADQARSFAEWLDTLHREGYVLNGPVADDYGFYYKPETAEASGE